LQATVSSLSKFGEYQSSKLISVQRQNQQQTPIASQPTRKLTLSDSSSKVDFVRELEQ
jgi:hypothetical protein